MFRNGNIENINPMQEIPCLGFRVEVIISKDGYEITSNELVNRIRKFRPYIELNNGGVLFKGEIISQIDFVLESCKICHKAGINTCIEIDYKNYNKELFKNIDFIILEINELPIYNSDVDKFINSIDSNNIIIKQLVISDELMNLRKYYELHKNIKYVDYIEK